MSVSILEVIEAAGYNLDNLDDASWLLSQEDAWDELIENAELLIEQHEEQEMALAEQLYYENNSEEDEDE